MINREGNYLFEIRELYYMLANNIFIKTPQQEIQLLDYNNPRTPEIVIIYSCFSP